MKMLNSLQRLHALFFIFLIGIVYECHAGTTFPIDLGEAFRVLMAYFVGLIILLIFLAVQGSKKLAMVFIAYISSPLIAYHGIISYSRYNETRMLREEEEGEAKNKEAFSEYCKSRQRNIYSKVIGDKTDTDSNLDETAISVRIDENFNGRLYDFTADKIASFMQMRNFECSRSTVRYLEGRFRGKYMKDNEEYEIEYQRYGVCNKSEKSVVDEITARYELVLGTSGSAERVPWEQPGIEKFPELRQWMTTSSVHIVDRFNGSILADDSMYFLNKKTGSGSCPSGDTQLAELIYEVFSSQ